MISTSHRWRKTALASLVAAAFGLSGSNASALALGRITVQSALGDPLRAEIDIPEINAEEAASLRPLVASPEAFKTAGLEYNPALAGVQISLQRRADGRAYLRLSSDRPVSEPFVDLILEASWASGRLVRDYTILLDPPSLRAAPAPTPVPPQTAPVQIAPPVASAPPTPRPAAPPAPAAAPARPAPAPSPAPPRAPAVAAPAPQPAGASAGNLVVRPGDTAGQIARNNKSSQVSLDQMLVALLRNNEGAFINGNLNRLKAGAVLTIPSEAQALGVSNAEARRTVVAHSRDFNAFRGKLAANAPTQEVAAANRSAGGSVQAQVQDNRSAAAAPDKLTLSKGAVQGQAAGEAAVAQNRAAQDAEQRAAEMAKNIRDLGNLSAATASASAAASSTAASAPAVPSSAPGVTIAAAPPVVAAASEPVAAPAPALPPSAPAATPPAVAAPAPNPAAAEESFLDTLSDNPLLLGAGAALLALLVALGLYKARQRRNNADVDSAFLESRLQPDSFFGGSGGQHVDTSEAAATGSSMVYSPSQLDAADDVDPVAEADVYLAYGRDVQAEEILREALRTHPGRIAIHQKLLDIYAKRRDTHAFEAIANEAYKLAGAGTQEWQHICEQGLGIDPDNALYQPGGQPSAVVPAAAAVVAAMEATAPLTSSTATQKMAAVPPSAPTPVDLDLDFSLDDFAGSSIEEAQPTQLEPTVAIAPVDTGMPSLDLDFGLATEPVAPPASSAQPLPVELALPDISKADDTLSLVSKETDEFRQQAEVSFGSTSPIPLQMGNGGTSNTVDVAMPDMSFGYTAPGELTTSQAPLNTPAPDSGMLEFDLGTLSLELDPDPAAAVPETPAEPEDPLATKLALAEEFVSIGDDDGARALIEEVIAEATGDLKAQAQRALSSLS